MAKRYIILPSSIEIARIFDDSNGAWPTTGLTGTSNTEFGWQYQLLNQYNIFPFNHAAGSTGFFTAINNNYQYTLTPSPDMMIMRSGYNDVKVFLTDAEGHEHGKSCLRAMLCNQFLASVTPASDASVTKTGTWSAESISTSKANRSGGTPMKSSTIGDTISFAFTGTNIVVFVRHSNGTAATYGSVRVKIDGNPAIITGNMDSEADDEYSMNNKAYNVTTSGGFIFGAFQVKGLSSGAHTIELELLEAQTTIIDSLGQLADPEDCMPAIIGDVCHDNTGTSGRNEAINAWNLIVHAMLEAEFTEYLDANVLAYAFLNNFVSEADTTDNVHFNLQGHTDIAAGIQDVINTL